MVRDVDLYITVPHFFRCPISLDVMTSPVSLCTGVTYDRSSIQRWLDGGNNTCPATMQVLHSKEFVPNRTLKRLIQIWSASHPHQNNAVTRPSVPSRGEIEVIVRDINATSAMDELSKFELFARESEENQEFLANLDGFLPVLTDFLGNSDGYKNIELMEHIVRVLVIILDKIVDREKLMRLILNHGNNNIRDCLSSLFLVIRQGKDSGARIGSVRVLESMAISSESKVRIADQDGLLPELVRSLSPETEPAQIEATLSCLIALSTAKRVKVKLVNLKAIPLLRDFLGSARDAGVSVTEKALKLLETLSSCKEGREELCREKGCVEAVVGKVMKVSGTATEHAVAILWGVCCIVKDERAQEAVMRSNGLTKVLLLMQSNCSPVVRQMAAELLKVFRVDSRSSNCVLPGYDTDTMHVMPF